MSSCSLANPFRKQWLSLVVYLLYVHSHATLIHSFFVPYSSPLPSLLVHYTVQNLFVSSSAVDTDFAVKLIDVWPTGESMLIQDGILRMKWRENNTTPVYVSQKMAGKWRENGGKKLRGGKEEKRYGGCTS
jgi:hypothetical protein